MYLKKNLFLEKFRFSSNLLDKNNLSYWDKYLLTKKYSNKLIYEQVIDLSIEDGDIWNLTRKSYRGLINKFKKNYKVNVLKKSDIKIWRQFQKFHMFVAKKKTRKQITWDNQLKSLKNRSAYFFYIRDNNKKLIAGSLFDCTKDEAYYSVGVYDGNLKHLPLTHLILYESIDFFKKKNLKNINLGEVIYKSKNIDKKILNIQSFKSGFATNITFKTVYY